ncbi:MAG: FG-GAP-like repeat-containing protein [Planctomycetota bacterium]
MKSKTPCLALSFMLVALVAAHGQTLPKTSTATEPHRVFNNVIRILGDVDGDGCEDAAHSMSATTNVPFQVLYKLAIVSGRTGADLRVIDPWGTSGSSAVFPAPDLDGDGLRDYIQSTAALFGSSVSTTARSGLTGAIIGTFVPANPANTEGILRTAPMGDVDADGTDDFAAILFQTGSTIPAPGQFELRVYSGATLTPMATTVSVNFAQGAFTIAGDIDGDGADDIAVRDPSAPGVVVLSGVNLAVIRTLPTAVLPQTSIHHVVATGDVDGDGLPELAVLNQGNPNSGSMNNGHLQIFSSATNTAIATALPLPVRVLIGIEAAGDWDGDGIGDIWAIERQSVTVSGSQQYRRVLSGATGAQLVSFPNSWLITGSITEWTTGIQQVAGDRNGDGVAEYLESNQMGPAVMPTVFDSRTFLGAGRYGPGTTTLDLTWRTHPAKPQWGFIEIDGATPFASLLVGVSLAPANATIFGTSFPLLISPLPGDLFLTANLVADGSGRFSHFELLHRPSIAGTVLYYQAAETAPTPAVSNGLELLFSGI